MSTIAERARLEADRVEAENPEPEPEPEPTPEPEPEPEPQAGISEKEIRAMEREDDRHRQAVDKLLGAATDSFQRCPLCEPFPAGYVPLFQTVPDEAAAEMGARTFDYFQGGDLIEPPYREARTMTRCTDCDGWGLVRSGAQNQLHRVEQCPACTGNGFVPRELNLSPPMVGMPAFGQPPQATAPQLNYYDVNGQPCAVPPDQYGQAWLTPGYGSPPGNGQPAP